MDSAELARLPFLQTWAAPDPGFLVEGEDAEPAGSRGGGP